jgi:enamine deaminase RidA (YjgF/YER057c/UK114 family)
VGISEHIDTFKKVRNELITEPYPAWTAIEVSGFITPGAIVEIRAVAETNSR